MKQVSSRDGTHIAFDQSGQGPVVILVSPAFGTRADAARLAGALAPDFTVFAYERRGT